MEDKANESGQHFHVAEVSTSVDEFQIRQTTYKFSLKLESTSGPLAFSRGYTNPAPIRCVRRSANLPFTDSKITMINGLAVPFSFHFELERDHKKQKTEIYNLFIKRIAVSGKNCTLLKHAVYVLCACEGKGSPNETTNVTKDFYPDCSKAEMIEFNQPHSCIQLGKHIHDWQVHGMSQEYFITITEFDFSDATVIPYEAQRILAKKEFVKQVKDTDGCFFEEIRKPFDVTIICKDGYEIDVHRYVLSTRNLVFKKMLSIKNQFSARGTSFRKLAKEAFLGKRDRNKSKISKTVTIDDSEISSGAMKVLLHFLYFGELHNDWKVELVGVLHGARKYGIRQMLDFVNVLLITMCKRKNALALLKLAERYSLIGAEAAIRDYVYTNLGDVLQATVKITSV